MTIWTNIMKIMANNRKYLSKDIKKLTPPVKPNKEDCCNSGCSPCIFDVYEEQLQKYESNLKAGLNPEDSVSSQENGISQIKYSTFILEYKKIYCDEHVLLGFSGMKNKPKVIWKAGEHFMVKYNSSTKSHSRAYTPLKLDYANDIAFFTVIKKYDNGLVSNFLYNLKVGDKTEWRGPYGNYHFVANTHDRVIMIAQGTGIAPFYSIIVKILNNQNDMTKIILYYCCQNPKVILFRNELYGFKEFWNFQYTVFVSDITSLSLKYEEPVIKNRLSIKDIKNIVPTVKDQFLICGSETFTNHFKNLLAENDIDKNNIVGF